MLLANIEGPIKINLSIKDEYEILDMIGRITKPLHIKNVINLFSDTDYTLVPDNETPLLRFPYDFSYADTTAAWENLVTTTGFFQSTVNDIAWFPNGKKLVIVGDPRPIVGTVGRIYDFSDSGTSLFGYTPQINNGGSYTFTWGGPNLIYTVTTVSVHPDDKHIIIGGVRTPENVTHRLIYFDEENTTTVLVADYDHGTTVRSVQWSPNGKYVAVAGDVNSNINLRIYRFENGTLHNLSRSEYFWDSTNPIYSVKWHPSGKYLALGGGFSSSNHTVKVVSFDKESVNELVGCRTNNGMTAGHVPEVAWDPDGKKLAVSHHGDSLEPRVYSFKNNLQLELYSTGSNASTQFPSVSYSPDGAYISFARPTQLDTYTSYEDGSNLHNIGRLNFTASTLRKISWDPGSNFLAFGTSTGEVRVLRLDEDETYLAKRLQSELFTMYESARHISSVTKNVVKPLAYANSNALSKYHGKNPESYTATFTESISANIGFGINAIDVSDDGSYIVTAANAPPHLKIYTQQGDLLIEKPLAQINSSVIYDSVAISPNNNYIAASSISGASTTFYHFNGYTLKQLITTATGGNNIKWYQDNTFFLHNGGVYYLNGSVPSSYAVTAQVATYQQAADLDGYRMYMAYITPPNILNIVRFNQAGTLTTVTGRPISNLSEVTDLSWGTSSTICMANTTASGLSFAACYFNGLSLSLIGTGVTSAQISKVATAPDGRHMTITLTADGNILPNILEYKLTPTTGPIIQIGSINHIADSGNGSSYPKTVKYTSNSDYLIIGSQSISGTTDDITMYKRVYEPFPYAIAGSYTILIGTSNATGGGGGGGNALNIATSDAIVTYQPLVQANSNVIVSRSPLIIANSNAIAGLLVNTSNAINNFVIPNSQVIVSQEELIAANSNVVATVDPLIKATSQVIVTYQPLALANSNAVSGLLVDTSNAIAGLLVDTSNATDGLLIDTSNTVATNATKFAPLDTIDTGPAHIHFNSPTITMSYDVFISADHQLNIHQSGVINGNGHSISFPNGSATAFLVDAAVTTTLENIILKNFNDSTVSLGAGSSLIFGNNCRVEISEAQSLSRPWFFAGSALLDAHNNQLTLNQADEYIAAREEALLTIANASLTNVGLNNIRCINDNASITFKNVSCHLTSDLTFSTGAISVLDDLKITGTSIFNFTTTKPLTINAASRLILDHSTSFNYAPASNNRTLLTLTDSTAQLVFNNATLIATATGPRLTKGTLIVDGNMHIQSSAASTAEAVVFGNGTPENDLIINLMPASGIKLLSGYLNYENAN